MGKKCGFILILTLVLAVALSGCKKSETQVTTTEEIMDYNRLRVVSATSSSDDGNVVGGTIDSYSDTRWSAEGDGETAVYDFGEQVTVAYAAIAFHQGDVRYTNIDLETSLDGATWTQVFSGNNKETPTLDLVKFDLEDVQARYVRLTGHGYEYLDGSKTGAWNSIVEVQFYGADELAMDPLGLSEQPEAITYTEVGMVNADGTAHEIHTPNPVTGKTHDLSKTDADLSASDTDDSVFLQEAIDGASSGDEVFLPAGTYDLYRTVYLKDGVNLRGEEGTILFSKPTSGEYPTNVITSMGNHDLVISNLFITSAFDGNFSIEHSDNNPEADGPRYVIRLQDSSTNKPSYNITVDHVTIEKYQTMGVRIANSHDIVVQNSTFQNATDLGGGGAGYGVSIQGKGNNIDRIGYSNDTRHNVVQNCEFVGPYLRHGTLLQYSAHNNLITNNTYSQIKLDAIDLHGEDEYLNEVSYNLIKDIETGAGIGVGNTGAAHDAAGPGNYIHHNEIINAREGVKVHMGSPDTVIEENVISGALVANAKGIYIQNAPGTVIRGNEIKDNTAINFWSMVFNGDAGDEGRGEGLPHNVLVEENTFANSPGGIKITHGDGLVFENNTYENIESMHISDTRKYDYVAELIPSQVLSLTNWKINLPIDNAKEIRQPELKTFEDERFFYVNESQDGVVFNAPCQADETDATTANSKYPRSELREMAYGGVAEANWTTDNGRHVMTIDEMITHTPEIKDHVVVGQIHDADDDVVMIRLEGKRLFVEAEGVDLGALDEDYTVGTRFEVQIIAENDVITVKYNGDEMVSYSVHKEGCYFKAGMYTQSNVSKGDAPDAYGEVIIYDLTVQHTGIEQANKQDYTNATIPDSASTAVLTTSRDTYIDLMKVDGLITANVSPRGAEDKLMVKTSSGQTTIRLAFFEFDLSGFSERPQAATLNLTGKDINGSSDVLIYGLERNYEDNLVWGDLFTEDSRISKNNTDVMDYLNHFGKLTSETTLNFKDPAKEVEEKDIYAINVSSFIAESTADIITLVMVDEIGLNVNLQLHSSDGTQDAYAPKLEVWTKSGAAPVEVEANSKEDQETEETPAESDAEDILAKNLDVVDVDEALNLLSYTELVIDGSKITLPSIIGKEVQVTWATSNEEIIDAKGTIKGESGLDVTLTATLSKGEEVTEKTFIIVLP